MSIDTTPTIGFKVLNKKTYPVVMDWLNEPHVMEFWDNSPEHKEDIKLFVEGRVVKSTYFNGIFDYWIATANEEPYALIMTAQETKAICPKHWLSYMPNEGHTYSLDYCIGNKRYLGKGLASQTLAMFCEYLTREVDPQTTQFIIDPDMDNPKAIHVYRKAGFEIKGEYDVDSGFFEGVKNFIMIKTMSSAS